MAQPTEEDTAAPTPLEPIHEFGVQGYMPSLASGTRHTTSHPTGTRPPFRNAMSTQQGRPRRVMTQETENFGPSQPGGPRRKVKWVDENYYHDNPWHDQESQKPIFSLGAPLPRKTRRKADKSNNKDAHPATKSKDELAELGQIPSSVSSLDTENPEQRSQPLRKTVNGVSHGDKYNDAGQPVFEYIPQNSHEEKKEENQRVDTRSKQNGPDFGIDSEPLGQQEQDDVEEGNADPNEYRNLWARIRAKHPEPLAEFLSTFVAIFMGLAGTLSVNLSNEKYGTYETTCWAWGFAWMFGIYLGGGVSGAHMNPAISFSLSVFRGFPWRQCLIYVVAQFLASLAAGALAWGIFRDTIYYIDPTLETTASSFFSTPQDWVSMGSACFSQIVGSAVMMLAVFALGDDQNNPPGAGMHAFVLGLLVTTLKFTLGYNIGSALNPASDFGPRVIAYAVGYRGPAVFSTLWWLYGPWLSTLAGSVVGCSIYDGFVFVGSESPINWRLPKEYEDRARKMLRVEQGK
ncbi:aquaporin-like protein [Xylariaceae sp. FL1272]|nr:aquaporin-like protein [Xylariaceae sp. FL1272]